MGHPDDHPEQNAAIVPATLNKKKRKFVADCSAGNKAPSDSLLSTKGVNERMKKKKTLATVSEESMLPNMHASPGESSE